jgi:hypothetical protein
MGMNRVEPPQGESNRWRLEGQELTDDEVIEVLINGSWWRADVYYDPFGQHYKLYLPRADKILRFSTKLVARRVNSHR